MTPSTPPAGDSVRHACGHAHTHPTSGRKGTRSKQLARLAEQPCPVCRLEAARRAAGLSPAAGQDR